MIIIIIIIILLLFYGSFIIIKYFAMVLYLFLFHNSFYTVITGQHCKTVVVCMFYPVCSRSVCASRRAKVIVAAMAVFATVLGMLVALMYRVVHVDPFLSRRYDDAAVAFDADNATTTSSAPDDMDVVAAAYTYHGQCRLTQAVLGGDFQWFFQKFYTALYLACFVVVLVLYVLIYRSVLARRVRRQGQKRATTALVRTMTTAQRGNDDGATTAAAATTTVDGGDETMITMVPKDDNMTVDVDNPAFNGAAKKVKRWSLTTREKNRIANLKTAAILFVVTVVFVVTYLPAFLMALQLIPYRMSIFYMYFVNNIANPLIYSFMNKTFRDDLRKLYQRH